MRLRAAFRFATTLMVVGILSGCQGVLNPQGEDPGVGRGLDQGPSGTIDDSEPEGSPVTLPGGGRPGVAVPVVDDDAVADPDPGGTPDAGSGRVMQADLDAGTDAGDAAPSSPPPRNCLPI